MSRFNSFMNGHFAGCTLIAESFDHCRNRTVKVFMLPGETEAVGVSDGTDAWIAPVIANPFSFDLIELFKKFADGIKVELPLRSKEVPVKIGTRSRHKLMEAESDPEPPPRQRRTVLSDPGEPKPQSKARRSLLIA